MFSIRQRLHAMLWTKRHLFQELEVKELTVLRDWFSTSDICLDIGAHGGAWTVPLSKLVPDGHVYAFEALPYYAETLRLTIKILRRLRSIPVEKNVSVLNQAVTSENRMVNLVWKAPDGQPLTGMTHLEGLEEKPSEPIAVTGMTLDAFQDKWSERKVRFIKVDVEGAELLVLRGAVELIATQRPIFYLEIYEEYCRRYGYHPDDIFNFMNNQEYRAFLFGDDGLLPTDLTLYPGQGDVLFVPSEIRPK